MNKMNRDEAMDLFHKYNETDSLRRHGYAVMAVMEHFAKEQGEDIEYWGNIGLLHDLDYEKFPEDHCVKTREILEQHGTPEEMIHSIESHAYGMCTTVKPELPMEKVLYTIDELTGLIVATVLMRPDQSILPLEVKSVKKKFKTIKFAAGVNREVILQGCKMLSMDLDFVIQQTIEGMKIQAELLALS